MRTMASRRRSGTKRMRCPATLASGPLFDALGAFGYLATALMALLPLAGAILLTRRARSLSSDRLRF